MFHAHLAVKEYAEVANDFAAIAYRVTDPEDRELASITVLNMIPTTTVSHSSSTSVFDINEQ